MNRSSSRTMSRGFNSCKESFFIFFVMVVFISQNGINIRSEFFDGNILIRVDTNVGGSFERLPDNFFCRKIGMTLQHTGGSQGIIPARTDGNDTVVRLDDFSRSGNDQSLFFIEHGKQRLKLSQIFIGAPEFGKLDGSTKKISMVL